MEQKTDFFRGFIAFLVKNGVTSISPHSQEDRRRFMQLFEELNAIVDDTPQEDRQRYRCLVRLRNELVPSNTGALDGIETAFRNLQLSLTSSPNPFYDEIAFDLPPAHAESLFQGLSEADQKVVSRAAGAFLRVA